MAVLIKGMEMPKNCEECGFKVWDGYEEEDYCPFSGIVTLNIGRQVSCPLIEVPEPHGDLIDRRALMEGEGRYFISLCKEGIDVEEILRAKTIIPASKEGM